MNFRQWLTEWEGAAFPGDDNQYYNTPAYPRSRYKGPGLNNEPGHLKKIDQMYAFKPTYVFKSMKKMKVK